MFVATVRWEYRVTPSSSTMRFACISDPAEYRELRQDLSVTDAWYFEPIAGLDGSSSEVFSLLECSIDGAVRPARRSTRKGSQLFTVNLGEGVVSSGKEMTISYTYRSLVQRHSHLLHLDLARPTKGFTAELRYGGCGIRHVSVLDYIASAKQPRISGLTATDPAPGIEVGFDSWVFPKGGVAFVWVLEDELGAVSRAV